MIKLINKITGGEMWVAEARLDKYLAAGHKLAADMPVPEMPKEAPKKRPTARRRKKKED